MINVRLHHLLYLFISGTLLLLSFTIILISVQRPPPTTTTACPGMLFSKTI